MSTQSTGNLPLGLNHGRSAIQPQDKEAGAGIGGIDHVTYDADAADTRGSRGIDDIDYQEGIAVSDICVILVDRDIEAEIGGIVTPDANGLRRIGHDGILNAITMNEIGTLADHRYDRARSR
jgi:hypothetical protein